jgi:hypothetical protein
MLQHEGMPVWPINESAGRRKGKSLKLLQNVQPDKSIGLESSLTRSDRRGLCGRMSEIYLESLHTSSWQVGTTATGLVVIFGILVRW